MARSAARCRDRCCARALADCANENREAKTMEQNFTICVGTVGAGVWFSPDGGDHWRRSKMDLPFHAEPGEVQIRALALSPHNPHHVYAGSEAGLYRSVDNGASFELVPSPMEGTQIWSVAVDPQNPDVIYAGTKPPAVFRTLDGGKRWERLAIPIAEKCLAGAPKVTNGVFDPRNPRTIWVGVEIDGVYRSGDGGESWSHCPALGDKPLNQDVHGLVGGLGGRAKNPAPTPS